MDFKRQRLWARWQALESQLEELQAGRVVWGSDPATREAELLRKQDQIEMAFESMPRNEKRRPR